MNISPTILNIFFSSTRKPNTFNMQLLKKNMSKYIQFILRSYYKYNDKIFNYTIFK